MKFTAVGDMIIQKPIPESYEGFAELAPFIMQGDARFFNLETTLNHEGETCASAFSGGTYLRTNPEVLEDIKPFGFNMTSFNNNHALDFSYAGFLATLDAVDQSGLVHTGAGRSLEEASAPRYLQTPNGTVALISVNCDFDPSAMAGEKTARVPGRPGVNGLRVEKRVELPPEEFNYLKKLANASNINAEKEIVRKEGYFAELAEGEGEFGELKFFRGKEIRCVIQINTADMQRVERAICEARKQADYVMISIHTHQICGDTKEIVPEFLQDFAHRCIDLGAHAILGHGPHLLRPIEIYKDCPIFYSLGDFVLQLYDVEFAPADFYIKNGLPTDATVYELLKKRSKNFTVGLMEDKRMSRSVIPFWETDGTKLTSLKLMSIELVMKGDQTVTGLPRRSANPEIAEYLADMCKPYGTKIVKAEDGLLECKWN